MGYYADGYFGTGWASDWPMTKHRNPYSWNKVNLALFFGRESLVSHICDRLEGKTESFAILGGRRMGKTTVLRKIEEKLRTRQGGLTKTDCTLLPVYIDFQGLGLAQDPTAVWREILGQIAHNVRTLKHIDPTSLNDGESALIGTNVSNPFKIVHSALLSFFGSCSTGTLVIVLLLDEVERLLLNEWCDDFWRNWRALVHNTPGIQQNLCIILSGSVELTEIAKDRTSSLWGILDTKFLETFSYEDSKRLITEPGAMALDDSTVDLIIEWSGGHPFIIQYLMSIIYENQSMPPQDALGKARTSFLEGQAYIMRTWWSQLGPIGREIYRLLIATEGPVRKDLLTSKWLPDDVNWALDVIRFSGLGQTTDTTSFAAIGTLFKQWLKGSGRLETSETQKVPTRTPETALVKLDKYACQEWNERNEVDHKLKIVELELRSAISSVYRTEWGNEWEEHVKARLKARLADADPERSIDKIEERRKTAPQKYASLSWVAPPELIHYTTIGHLESLISDEWQYFNFIFGSGKESRRRFADNFSIIAKMRNELSHPIPIDYPIPQTELNRAKVACDDILTQLGKNLSS